MELLYRMLVLAVNKMGVLPVLDCLICVAAEHAATTKCLTCSNIAYQLAIDLGACKMRAEHLTANHKANDLTII